MRLPVAVLDLALLSACTSGEAPAPAAAVPPVASYTGERCDAGAAEQRTCRFIAAVQADPRGELFNQETPEYAVQSDTSS